MNRAQVASNLRSPSYPEFSVGDFYAIYPQFQNLIPEPVVEMYVEQAVRCIQQSRWHAMRKSGMCCYIAHHLTLWLMANAPAGSSGATVAAAGMVQGSVSSKSVDGVSIGYSQSGAQSDLTGWGAYKETIFGEQFATMARIVGKGGMYVI